MITAACHSLSRALIEILHYFISISENSVFCFLVSFFLDISLSDNSLDFWKNSMFHALK